MKFLNRLNKSHRRLALATLFCCLPPTPSPGQASHAAFRGHNYAIYIAEYPKEHIRFFWRNGQKQPYRSIGNLKTDLEKSGHELIFATNAGMYTPDNTPCGLYVENAGQLRPAVLQTEGTGNFFMQPNGVFLLTKTGAKVIPTQAFSAYRNKTVFATQSGPMLVCNGTLNNHFTAGSVNEYIRSGVGVNRDGKVVFAISEQPVNFYDFACLFKDVLKCDNALYLDGAISSMYLPLLHLTDTGGDFGAIIAVVK